MPVLKLKLAGTVEKVPRHSAFRSHREEYSAKGLRTKTVSQGMRNNQRYHTRLVGQDEDSAVTREIAAGKDSLEGRTLIKES